jgi:Rps23 Pro-64 3,4-dihydroxylase Tpa1-like proline 4-hydroxylase
MHVYESLIQNGYYVGSSYDIFSEQELIHLENAISNDVKLGYDVQFSDGNYKWLYNLTASRKPFDTAPYDHNSNKPIPHNQIKIKKERLRLQRKTIDQQWYYTGYNCISGSDYSTIETAKEKITNFVKDIYSISDPITLDPLNITVYDKGDFILPHSDGKNENRICALLIYLTSKENYDPSYGGRLYIQPSGIDYDIGSNTIYDMQVCVEPVRPNYVILDFTQHNVLHAVEICKQQFNRYAILTFPTIIK